MTEEQYIQFKNCIEDLDTFQEFNMFEIPTEEEEENE